MTTSTLRLARVAAALCTGLLLHATPAGAADVGQPAPAFSLPGASGTVSLQGLQGQLVLVDFWASWCGPCKLSLPWLAQLQQRYGSRGLQVVAINLDRQRAPADAFLAQALAGMSAMGATLAVAYDPAGDVARRFAIRGMPSSVLVAPDGRVLMLHTGFRDDDRAPLEAAIVAALPRR
jgi:cytochrome c biogenesis protein CcmG, thiol:disulfide interchange protein DsbE